MRFPNACKGVKKLFIAELLTICVSVLTVAAVIMVAASTATGVVAAAGVFVLLAGILGVVAFILKLVGLGQGGKDNSLLKVGFWVVMLALALSIANVFIKQFASLPTLTAVFDVIITVSDVIVMVYVIDGISEMTSDLGHKAFASKGKSLIILIICLILMSIVLNMLSTFIVSPSATVATLLAIFAIIGALVELFVYIMFLTYLGTATKLLKE